MSKIVAIMAVNRFPLWKKAYYAVEQLVDEVYVRFDGINGDPEILKELYGMKGKLKGCNVVASRWSCPEWREECLRMLDGHCSEGDVVIALDEDETFGDGIREEIALFRISDKRGMMFSYAPLESDDKRVINGGRPYPEKPHMKVFKWKDGLSYYPYHGNGKPATYHREESQYSARTKIHHWSAYTRGLEEMKHWRNDMPGKRAKKVVTLLGFGLSASQGIEAAGEIWSMNDCYNVMPKDLMRNVTRIYEMHDLDKRKSVLTVDGKSHLGELDRLGRLGHRIICQKPDPRITGSEAYPIDELRRLGYPMYFTGTPVYLLAQAVLEGFTEIRMYGLDQLDWEHQLQRQAWIFWCGIAMGRGIDLGGSVTFLKVFAERLYGYEYGPEWDDECTRLQWLGFPFEVKMKVESRAQSGDLYHKGDK